MVKEAQAGAGSDADIERSLEGFHLDSFSNPTNVEKYADRCGIRSLCRMLEEDRLRSTNTELIRTVSLEAKPAEADLQDLCRLHWLALSRKAISVLEFGSGFSTVVLADAMRRLSGRFADWARDNLRCKQPFHVHSVDEDDRFVEITRRRLGADLDRFATITRSPVSLTTVDHRFATFYSSVPNVCPDFIYLDGPSQFATADDIRGFTLADRERMPMAADILAFEFFLQPGTLILIDGRTANARFLRSYLRRDWKYLHDPAGDIHYFELQEAPLGPVNARQLTFCLGGKWLLDGVAR